MYLILNLMLIPMGIGQPFLISSTKFSVLRKNVYDFKLILHIRPGA